MATLAQQVIEAVLTPAQHQDIPANLVRSPVFSAIYAFLTDQGWAYTMHYTFTKMGQKIVVEHDPASPRETYVVTMETPGQIQMVYQAFQTANEFRLSGLDTVGRSFAVMGK